MMSRYKSNQNMSLKIKVNLGVNVENLTHEFDLEDLGISESEWEAMPVMEKKDFLQKEVNRLPEQPYWLVENFDNA